MKWIGSEFRKFKTHVSTLRAINMNSCIYIILALFVFHLFLSTLYSRLRYFTQATDKFIWLLLNAFGILISSTTENGENKNDIVFSRKA